MIINGIVFSGTEIRIQLLEKFYKPNKINEPKSVLSDRSGFNDDENSNISSQDKAANKSASDPKMDFETPVGSSVSGSSWFNKERRTILKRKKCDEELKKSVLKALIFNTPKIDDDDILFFNSIIPMMRSMNNLEKLVFRTKIMNKLINIKLNSSNTVLPRSL